MIYNCDENQKYIQTDSNELLRFHTLELPRMVAHIIL